MATTRRAALILRRIASLDTPSAHQISHRTLSLHTTPKHTLSPFLGTDRSLPAVTKLLQPSQTLIGLRFSHHEEFEAAVLPEKNGVPPISNLKVKQALYDLLATNWFHIENEVREEVEAAIAGGGDDVAVLSTVWSSAQASEKFAEVLTSLRMELDELSGAGGDSVRKMPEILGQALESAYVKYAAYLDSIGEEEGFLKKKVENDLGSILVQMRQRLCGLDSKWGKITLLGTSGLSGSYIELRHHT